MSKERVRVSTSFSPEIGNQILAEAERDGNKPTAIVRRIVTRHYKEEVIKRRPIDIPRIKDSSDKT